MLGRARDQESGSINMSDRTSGWLSRHRRVLVSVAAVGIAATLVSLPLAGSSAASRTASPAAIPAAAARQLGTMTQRWATTSGDAKPLSTEAVTTTRDKGLRLATPGDTFPGSAQQTVYLVVMKGNFTLTDVPIPPHGRAPTGHYLTFTVDPATFQVMDMGISNHAPPGSLGSLGPVSTLAP
jgi:hypothetical protein